MAATKDHTRTGNDQGDALDFGAAGGSLSLKNWGDPPKAAADDGRAGAIVDCGWGRILFGQTFAGADDLARELLREKPGERDLVFYARDPHVLLAAQPQAFFLDPSHTFRLEFPCHGRSPGDEATAAGCRIRAAAGRDQDQINRIYRARAMVSLAGGFCARPNSDNGVIVLVAEADDGAEAGSAGNGGLLGVVMGVDHRAAFADPDNGASLWALAVDPQAPVPGVGVALVTHLAGLFEAEGRAFMDLSVLHDNDEAIQLYQSMGFTRIPAYCIKKKNSINEPLFIGPEPEATLNSYAKIIIDEARRRGIAVTVEDAEAGLFTLSLGGKTVSCRESLTDMTSAVALSRCDDKALTRRLLAKAGINVPDQISAKSAEDARAFLARHGRIVIKPARGEQGQGVFVDLATETDVDTAFAQAAAMCDHVVAEEYVGGEDIRIIVIDGAVVAAATRQPAAIVGDGRHAVAELIAKQSRRRRAATGGESAIPLDDETRRCVADQGYAMDGVPPAGVSIPVRKTANLHSGGTIHDVTPELHPGLAKAARRSAEALQMPVVGLDFIAPAVDGPDYWVVEANERPGLANHEPQPTAERFVDFLFPESIAEWRQGGGS